MDSSIKCLPVVLPALDFSTVKNEVFPPIASTFSRTSSLAIKVRSLEAFCVLCGGSADDTDELDDLSGRAQSAKANNSSILDKYTIQEKLVPSLKAIKTKEPSVMMAALKVFRQVGKVADTDFLALEILPILWSFSLGPLLNLEQFNDFMALIKSLSTKIEKEQARKLQELSSRADTGSFQNGTHSLSQSSPDLTSPDTDGARNNFERLVLGKNTTPLDDKQVDLWGTVESAPQTSKRSTLSPAFSWSTTSGATASQTGSSSQLGFRSVTPDQKLNTFPSLEPTRQTSPPNSYFPAMQQTSPTWSGQSQGVGKPSPSFASLPSMISGMPATTPLSQNAANYSAFSIPPPPGESMRVNSGIESPSLPMNNTTPNWSTQLQSPPLPQPPTTQKQGLDKYESLL